MLGSGINPESFKLDYSGMANAAATQAQGVANLGANIGGAIAEVGDYFKKQAEDEKKVQKSLSVAKAIGDLIPGLQPTIQGSLNILNDRELPLSQRTAEADAIADILNLGINEVRNRQDVGFKERELGIREAQFMADNAPPLPAFTGSELKKTDKGDIYVLKGNDGLDYDPKTKLPIFDLAAFGEGLPPEVWSGTSTFSDDQGSITTPFASLPEEGASDAIDYANSLTGNMQGSGFPTNLNVARPAPFISPSQIESAANLGSNPLLGTRSGDNSDLPAIEAANQTALKPRYITGEQKTEETYEQNVEAGGLVGQRNTKTGEFKAYPGQTGGRITKFNPETGQLEIIEGSGAGSKAEGVAKAQEQMKGESFRLNQANTEEAFGRLDVAGTNNPLFAAGNSLLAKALPASEVGELESFFERINGENSFAKMSQLRASSPTGGAAGSMTEKEWPRFEGRFSPLKANAKKDTLAKSLSLNLLNAFEATNGTPDDVIKLLDEKKIDQAAYDNYVNDYIRNRQIARVNANGVEGKSYDWTRLNKKLLSKSTIFEAPASSVGSQSQDIYNEFLNE
jgi:hypothetical protein